MNRDEAVEVVHELLSVCMGLESCSLQIAPLDSPDSGYQIIIRGKIEEQTMKSIKDIVTQRHLVTQTGNIWKTKRSINKDHDTLIIYGLKK